MQTFPKNISQILHAFCTPTHSPKKLTPFCQFILVFGGVPTLQHLQSISMNVFQPMCHNFTQSSKYKGFGVMNRTLEVLPRVFKVVFYKYVALKRPCWQQYKGGLSSRLLASVLPSVAHLRLSRGSPLHPPVLLWRVIVEKVQGTPPKYEAHLQSMRHTSKVRGTPPNTKIKTA